MLTTDKTKACELLYQGLQLISKDVTAYRFQVHDKKRNASHAAERPVVRAAQIFPSLPPAQRMLLWNL